MGLIFKVKYPDGTYKKEVIKGIPDLIKTIITDLECLKSERDIEPYVKNLQKLTVVELRRFIYEKYGVELEDINGCLRDYRFLNPDGTFIGKRNYCCICGVRINLNKQEEFTTCQNEKCLYEYRSQINKNNYLKNREIRIKKAMADRNEKAKKFLSNPENRKKYNEYMRKYKKTHRDKINGYDRKYKARKKLASNNS